MSHTYKKGEYEYSSVTTIISDCTDKSAPLTQWAANMVVEWIKENCNHIELKEHYPYEITNEELDKARFNFREVSQKALDIGSDVHNAIETHLKGKEHALKTKEAENAFQAFLEWSKEHDLKPIKLEQTVYGNHWAGTLDFYGHFNSKLYVIDWKSSKAHYPEMRYQVAAYRRAKYIELFIEILKKKDYFKYKETYNKKIALGSGILRLDKETGMPDWKDHSKTYEKDLKVFNKMVDLYFERHPRIAKKAGWEE